MPREGLEVDNSDADLLARLLWANMFLAVFNLIPAFPMDGGRVLRAFLARRLGYARGTQIAASVGQAMAFLFGLLGLLGGNPLLVFIALFIYLAAASEAHAAQMRQVSRGMIVSDAMLTNLTACPPTAASRAPCSAGSARRSTSSRWSTVPGDCAVCSRATR